MEDLTNEAESGVIREEFGLVSVSAVVMGMMVWFYSSVSRVLGYGWGGFATVLLGIVFAWSRNMEYQRIVRRRMKEDDSIQGADELRRVIAIPTSLFWGVIATVGFYGLVTFDVVPFLCVTFTLVLSMLEGYY